MHLAGSFAYLLVAVLLGPLVAGAPTARSKPRTLRMPIRSLHRSVDSTADPNAAYARILQNAQNRHRRIVSISQQSGLTKRYNVPDDELEAFAAKAQQSQQLNQLDATPSNGSSNGGVSPLNIQAAIHGGVTNPSVAPSASNSVGMGIVGPDTGYVAIVEIGTPPQQFNILMDSGSADFWVGSESCKAETGGGDCGKHPFLGPQSSSSFVASQQTFNVTYGTGNAAGNLVEDNILLAGLSLPKHAFGVANFESSNFVQASFDGLMGLAQSGLSTQKLPTPVEALASAGTIEQAIVAYKIPRLADGTNDGEVTFGGLDPAKFKSDTLVQVPNVNALGFWEVDIDGVSVNGQNLNFQNQTAIMDTGTTLFVAPPNVASAIHAQIPGAAQTPNGFTVPCTTNASVALTIGGSTFAIDPRDIAFLPVDPNQPAGTCMSGIGILNGAQANQWLVGDTFLKNVYFATNVNDNIVLFAEHS